VIGASSSTEQIVVELAELLRDFEGRYYSDPIGADTRFFGDLGFSSIDAVLLGEKLEALCGRPLPFHEHAAQLANSGAIDLTVGQIATFLRGCLAGQT
jgi:acyl carrier protein